MNQDLIREKCGYENIVKKLKAKKAIPNENSKEFKKYKKSKIN